MDGWVKRVARKKRLNGEILKSPMRVFPGFRALGK